MDNRFKLLKIFGILFKVFAFGAVIIGAVGAVGVVMSKGSPETPRGISVVMMLVSGLYFVIFYTVSEVIKLLLAIEENTRKTASS